jgi:hypothetical protein
VAVGTFTMLVGWFLRTDRTARTTSDRSLNLKKSLAELSAAFTTP